VSDPLIEAAVDALDSLRPEAQRQVEYITEQLLYRRREAADIALLSDRLRQLTKGAIPNG
jgi:hypothetical protein